MRSVSFEGRRSLRHSVNFFIVMISCLLIASCSTTGSLATKPMKSRTLKAKIARLFSTPTYSIHNLDKIKLEKRNNVDRIYIRKNDGNEYGIHNAVVDEVEKRLTKNGIKLVRDVNNANFILNIKILSVVTDIDYSMANELRNALTIAGMYSPFTFDNNNSPHISAFKIGDVSKNKTTSFRTRRGYLPSVIYTIGGAGVGFSIGFLLAGTTAPIAIGLASGVLLGGTTYYAYNTFRRVGVVVIYEIEIEERSDKTLQHARKTLLKSSANISEESFYTYSDNWKTYVSKNVAMAIGSRVLIDDMLCGLCPLIEENVLDLFEKNK